LARLRPDRFGLPLRSRRGSGGHVNRGSLFCYRLHAGSAVTSLGRLAGRSDRLTSGRRASSAERVPVDDAPEDSARWLGNKRHVLSPHSRARDEPLRCGGHARSGTHRAIDSWILTRSSAVHAP
jgi:hypothetical protein